MRLGSRNLGSAGLSQPSRVCDKSIATWQSDKAYREEVMLVAGSSAESPTKSHQGHLPSHPVSEPLTAKASLLHSKFDTYVDPEISKSATVFSLSVSLCLLIFLSLSSPLLYLKSNLQLPNALIRPPL